MIRYSMPKHKKKQIYWYIASIQQNKTFKFSVCHAVKQKLKLVAKSIKTIIIISIFIIYLSVAH